MATLGVDLGGTNARAAVVDEQGRIMAVSKTVLVDRSPGAVVEAIAQAAAAAVEQAGAPVKAAGVGAAGQLRGDTGVMAVAPNLGWRNVPLGTLLQERLGYSVRVVNDLRAAAWGELHAGAGRGALDTLTVFVGSGVGSAIISGGRLVTGAGGVAGELGHTKVVPGGRRCGCGELGCLEAYVGGHNLMAQARELLAAARSPVLQELTGGDPAKVNPIMVEQAAEAGDEAAKEVYERAALFLAMAVANQVTVLNPARLVLGGGVLRNAPGLMRRVQEGVRAYASTTSRESLLIVEAELGDDSGIIGAALLA